MTAGRAPVFIEVGRPRNEDEVKAFTRVVSQALFFDGVDHELWVEREGVDNIRVARVNNIVVGGLVVQPLGQWFGGKSVPMGGVRGVGVAAEYRALGVASALLRASLEDMRSSGLSISTLYPSTQKVYRQAGFEKSGVRRQYKLQTHRIDVRDRALEIRPIEALDRETLAALYSERARRTAGHIDRSTWLWDRILDPPPWFKPTTGYLVSCDGAAQGYIVNHNTPGFSPQRNVVELQDFVATTPQAARRLWTFLVDHRSMAGAVTWFGAPAEPLLFLLDEQAFEIHEPIDWLLRIVDVSAALQARGYPQGLSAELHVQVRDDVLPCNDCCFVMRVENGEARVEEGGRGELVIDVRGLAPLYSGHLSARELLTTGYIEVSKPPSAEVLDTASAIFAGPAPWMPDMF